MNKTVIIDKVKAQALIDLFIHPVLVVDNQLNVISVNKAFQQDSILVENQLALLNKVQTLMAGEQELIFWQYEQSEKLLTAMPMSHGRTLIKIANSVPSALAKRYNILVNVIDQMSDAIIICNNDNSIDLINEQFQNVFTFTRSGSQQDKNLLVFLLNALQTIYPDDIKSQRLYFRYLKRRIHKQQACTFNFSLPNGQFYEYRDSLTFGGERIGLLINESTFKALNDQLENAFNEASELSAAKSNFMAAMSHEVRTPLNALIGLLDLCLLEPQLQSHEYIKRMSNSASSLLRLVNAVLDFSKFDAQKVELRAVNTNLRKLCETAIENFSGHSNTTTLLLYVDPYLPKEVTVDEMRLSQVLSNLISNGIKFNQNPHPELSLIVKPDELTGYITFTISDNGIGIDPKEQISIFSLFSQANHKIHGKFGGTGMGLNICQKICELMDGEIYVESELGKGSNFVVQLPLLATAASEIDGINTQIFEDTIIATNDPYFYRILQLYASSLTFKTHYYEELPKTLASTEMLCINTYFLKGQISLNHYPTNQLVYLCDNIDNEFKQNNHVIHRTPVFFNELLNIAQRQPMQPVNAEQQITYSSKSKLRALVVEDNSDNMFVLKKQFSACGIDSCFSMSAEEAVIFFEQQNFDLIISDYQMPGVSGAELLSILREIEQSENRPAATMLILTADKTSRCNEECMKSGADKILMKPLILRELSQLIAAKEQQLLARAPANIECQITNESPDNHAEMVMNETDFFIDERVRESAKESHSLLNIAQLRDIIGDINPQEEIQYLKQFAMNLSKVMSNMELAAKSEDWPKLRKLAHSLKSSAMIVGALQLRNQCEMVEETSQQTASVQIMLSLWQDVQKSIYILQNNIIEYYTAHE
ncbi:ATP-binding protein [Paraglaciecola sp.]|uniref:hybrid sensor histidine kinase/response regulator n=1 Tax=Paraglaciecola sp. TaxID=1920173 RepID=UPI0030F39C2F